MMGDLDDPDFDAMFADLTAATLPDIDQRPMCECPCTTEGNRHSDRRCDKRATEFVTVHRIGYCTEPNPAADEDGNLAAYMCSRCASFSEQSTVLDLKKAKAAHRGAIVACPSCHRPLETATDMMTRTKLI